MSVADWLMSGDPAIRWQTMRDLLDADPVEVADERARVAREGWGARLLALQRPDGSWAGGAWFPEGDRESDEGQPWTSTAHVLMLLTLLGADPDAGPAHEAAERAFAAVLWEDGDEPFLEGESEACTLATAIAVGAYFGHDMAGPAARLVADAREDGGWNCDPPSLSRRSSLHSTIAALEALEAQHRAHGLTPEALEAVDDAREYLLMRGLMYGRRSGAVIDPAIQRFSFPTYWHYDVLRALDHLRAADAPRDPRLADAIALLRARRSATGLWPLENTHRGVVPLVMEDGDGRPSRWNTLHALRVLRWWEGRD
ncbi:prenyltransferase/squalene oxidase repeat-containing protein [Demequina mangrovi]|uniref:Prenyltransferase and squalene oxidase repeat-containing protein n=1 Tax=Demequina mangrovi TaxID=1043493 RepID=A0A1H7B0M3_9MICO|nr:prenyltransferase/squalene oxidase repeat-containing protein [Demequina mangrovi]SEJ71058.1 hypothetical protein SAMN05421637_2769 [Demequina mangrovi]